MAASDRRKKLLLRGSALFIVIAVIAFGLSSTVRNRSDKRADAAAAAAIAALSADSVVPQGETPAAAAVATAPAGPPSTNAAHGLAVFEPIIGLGETPLADGATATRTDSGVTVAFDTPELRTRIPEKFERYLRATLPRIYGPHVDSVLATVAPGKLSGQGDLLYELPVRGIHLPLDPARHLEIFPEIRPGRDGPLVIRYRAAVAKN